MTWPCVLPHSTPGTNSYGCPVRLYHGPPHRSSSMATTTEMPSTSVQLCQQWSLGSLMRKGPICAQHVASYSKGASWCTIPPGMRRSGSPPMGLPKILAGQKREWWSHWQILCPAPPKRQTTSQSSGPVTSWPRLMNPLWKMSTRGCRRMTSVSRCRRMMSIYPHPSWRITSVRRWRDGGNQTPKHHLVTRHADKVRPNQR